MCTGIIAFCAISTFVVSCQEEVNDTPSAVSNQTASVFMSSLDDNLESFMDKQIVTSEPTQNESRSQNDCKVRKLYIDLSDVEEPVALEKIKTPRQILNIMRTTGAEISLINDGTYTHYLTISEDESSLSLNSLVLDSKAYLYSKGFSESDIQTMLKENNADESALVPFVIALTEEEEYQQSNPANNGNSSSDDAVDWDRAGRCSLHALGVDILTGLAQSSAKVWSKAAIKAAFKTLASKIVGPVGVAIFVIDFTLCYTGVI